MAINRRLLESLAVAWNYAAVCLVMILAAAMVVALAIKSLPVLAAGGWSGIMSSTWHPTQGQFGLLPFFIGTLEVTALAMLIAVPLCLLSAIYLAEYATTRTKKIILPVIDILAGIPSVVYGLFGILAIVPAASWLASLFGVRSTGYSLLAGGIILAIMVFPVIISVLTAVLGAVPRELRESSLSLGATKWQTIKKVVLRSSLRGIMAAVVLGFSRAIGETMAVMMVIGNVPAIATSLFDPAYPLTALIANNYGEMMSIPLYDSALLFAAFVLLLLAAASNVTSHLILRRIERGGSRQ